jgi:hypothetical protein
MAAEKKTATKKPAEEAPTPQPGVDWQPTDEETRLGGETAEEIVARKSEDRTRGDAFRKSFVLQTNKVELEDLKADSIQMRGMAQQVINEALYKGLRAKAQPKLEDVEVIEDHDLRPTQSVKFSWAVKVIPAVLDLDPSSTIDKVQAEDEEKHRDPAVSHEARPS